MKIKVSVFKGFKNKIPIKEVSLKEWLLSDTFKDAANKIRQTTDNKQRKFVKSNMLCITPSGIFSTRNSNGLIKHSGFICIDIDGKDNPHIKDWQECKNALKDCKYIYYCGFSAGGNGIYILFKIATPENHKEHFLSIADFFIAYNLIVDTKCKDICRLRTGSYDASPIFNENSLIYEDKKIIQPIKRIFINNKGSNSTSKHVWNLIKIICKEKIDITDDYGDWYSIGQSLASHFGESGREMYHQISSISVKYNIKNCNTQYNICLNNCTNFTIGTFLFLCKKHKVNKYNRNESIENNKFKIKK